MGINEKGFSRLDLNKGIVWNDTLNYQRLLSDIKRIELMTREEELDLFDRYWQAEDEEEKIAIRNKIVENHLRFILSFANAFNCGKASISCDLFGVLAMGMMKCIDRYTDTTFTFLTYAIHYMRKELAEYHRKWGTIVRQTNNAKFGAKVKNFENMFFLLQGRKPTEDETIAYLDTIGIKVKRTDLSPVVSVRTDAQINEEQTFEESDEFVTITANANTIETAMEMDANKVRVAKMMQFLTDTEKQVICLAYGINTDYARTDEQIAEMLGYTRQGINNLRKTAEKKLASIGRRILA